MRGKIKKLNSGKTFSLETRELMRISKLNKKHSSDVLRTQPKGEKPVIKCLKITQAPLATVNINAYLNGVLFKNFSSIADAAEFFFNDRNKRSPIRTALEKNKLLLNKYELKRN